MNNVTVECLKYLLKLHTQNTLFSVSWACSSDSNFIHFGHSNYCNYVALKSIVITRIETGYKKLVLMTPLSTHCVICQNSFWSKKSKLPAGAYMWREKTCVKSFTCATNNQLMMRKPTRPVCSGTVWMLAFTLLSFLEMSSNYKFNEQNLFVPNWLRTQCVVTVVITRWRPGCHCDLLLHEYLGDQIRRSMKTSPHTRDEPDWRGQLPGPLLLVASLFCLWCACKWGEMSPFAKSCRLAYESCLATALQSEAGAKGPREMDHQGSRIMKIKGVCLFTKWPSIQCSHVSWNVSSSLLSVYISCLGGCHRWTC